MLPSIGRIPTDVNDQSRNHRILEKLRKLNIMSQLEGLLQLLNPCYNSANVHDETDSCTIKEKYCRALQMILFAPNVVKQTLLGERDPDLYIEFVKDSIGLTASVREFCHRKVDKKGENQDKTKEPRFVVSKIFVNNISFKTKQRELWDFFQHFGKVLRATIVKDHRTKRSRGFGFVLFASPLAAEKALKAKKIELFLDGRYLKVTPAVRKQGRKRDSTSSSSMYGAQKRLQKVVDEFQKDTPNLTEDEEEELKVSERIEENVTTGKYWANLPEVIFLNVISYLEIQDRLKLERVCKSWRDKCLSAWHSMKYLHFKNIFNISRSSKTAGLTSEILISIIQKGCYNLQSLDLSASPYFIDHYGMAFVCKKCVNLQEINLSQVKLKNKTLQLMGKKLINLKKLQLNNCYTVGEKGMWWLLKNLKKLEHVEVTNSNRINGKCFFMLPETLKTAIFSSCPMVSEGNGLKYLSRCVNLTSLNLSCCRKVKESGLQEVFQNCVKLETLNLSNMGEVLTSIPSLRHLKCLTSLDISVNACVDDEMIKDVINSCHLLRGLNIEACHGNITSQSLQLLATLPRLEELDISYITSVDDSCLTSFATEGRLKSLNIRACAKVTDTGVACCLADMVDLRSLDISGCYNVNGSFVRGQEIQRRNQQSGKPLVIFLGGTEVTSEDMSMLSSILSDCVVKSISRSIRDLRNDFDATMVSRPFFPEEVSDAEENEDVDFDELDFYTGDDVPMWMPESYDDELPADVLEDGGIPWVCIEANNEDFEDQPPSAKSPQVLFTPEEEDWDQKIEDSHNK